MRQVERRLRALEGQMVPHLSRPWHQVLVDDGDSEDEAVARYEAEHGSIDGDNLMVIQFV